MDFPNPLLRSIYETGQVRDGAGEPVYAFPAAVSQETGMALFETVLESGAERTLEIGMGYGVSTLFIGQAHRDRGRGRHTAVDPNQRTEYRSIGLLNLERAQLTDLVTPVEEPSHVALPRLEAEGERFDLVFIDGLHLFDVALVDFFYADRLLPVGGYLVVDDLWMPAIRRVLAYVRRNRDYEFSLPRAATSVPLARRARRVARRVAQQPFARDWSGAKWRGVNACLLRKRADDHRGWAFHRSF
jgi:predicted O-methyltransferase YrrM